MTLNASQIILVFAFTFIVAIDQFNLSESLYQPIVTGAVIGLILGDIRTGLIIGGTYQLMTIGNIPVAGTQPVNVAIGGVMAAIFAITSKCEIEVAIAFAVPFAFAGQFFITVLFTAMAPMMSAADKMAEKADVKGIVRLNYIGMIILGVLCAVICTSGLVCGEAAGNVLSAFFEKIPWLMTGLGAAGSMMRFVGVANLLERMMLHGDFREIYLLGFLMEVIMESIGTLGTASLLLIIMVGILFVLYDYRMLCTRKKISMSVGGDENGI